MFFRRTSILGWEIVFLFDYGRMDGDAVLSELSDAGAPSSVAEKVDLKIRLCMPNEGFTYSNLRSRRSVVAIGPTTSGREFLSTFCHELRHLTDDIASERGLPIRGEDVAYLTGELARRLFPVVCRHCRKSPSSSEDRTI